MFHVKHSNVRVAVAAYLMALTVRPPCSIRFGPRRSLIAEAVAAAWGLPVPGS